MTTPILQLKGRGTEGKYNKVTLMKKIYRPATYVENSVRNK